MQFLKNHISKNLLQPLIQLLHKIANQIRDNWNKAKNSKVSNRRLAFSLAFGEWIGTSPFLGMHTLSGISFATLFKLPKSAVLTGTFLSMPLLLSLIIPHYQLGRYILKGKKENIIQFADNLEKTRDNMGLDPMSNFEKLSKLVKKASSIYLYIVVGWATLGTSVSFLFYFLCFIESV